MGVGTETLCTPSILLSLRPTFLLEVQVSATERQSPRDPMLYFQFFDSWLPQIVLVTQGYCAQYNHCFPYILGSENELERVETMAPQCSTPLNSRFETDSPYPRSPVSHIPQTPSPLKSGLPGSGASTPVSAVEGHTAFTMTRNENLRFNSVFALWKKRLTASEDFQMFVRERSVEGGGFLTTAP